ncbi:hypothetical protein [Collimonas humicola]|uniref:hypothetical protein n=1 Tax=Collimonas humicola TaxID=2825886 RepID=UPI001B8DA1EC|nr:hypothetical protein [Collimonas humicola]
MTANWDDFLSALDKGEVANEFANLLSKIAEPALVSDFPDEGDGAIAGKTKYFQFFRSGIEFALEEKKLKNINFYIQPHEGYESFEGKLLGNLAGNQDDAAVIQIFGVPARQGGGKMDQLLGYIYPWVKYEKDWYAVRMEFAENHLLRKVSLMLK